MIPLASGQQYLNNATDNYANVLVGRAQTGNDFYAGYSNSDFIVDSYAENNEANAQFGEASSGNDIGVGQTRVSFFGVRNQARRNNATSAGAALAGNRFQAREISDGYYGYYNYYNYYPSSANIQQIAKNNTASSTYDSSLSGNQFSVDDITGSEVNVQNDAEANSATSSTYGDSTSGNVNELANVGNNYYTYGTQITLNNNAENNDAASNRGSATSGNSNFIRTRYTGSDIRNNATNNFAFVNSTGPATSGNLNIVKEYEGYYRFRFNNLFSYAQNNNASAYNGDAVAGNDNRVKGSYFSSGRTRGEARGNLAFTYIGDSVSGNRNQFRGPRIRGDILTGAQQNYALAVNGTAVAGNDNTASEVSSNDIDTNAQENAALAGTGDAVSGNRNIFERVSSYVANLDSQASDNFAYSGGQGEAISGNKLDVKSNNDNSYYYYGYGYGYYYYGGYDFGSINSAGLSSRGNFAVARAQSAEPDYSA
eukprot:TRINITY_DN633_c0_g1_i7.p1 TRINITY_DN633_c0_g1~~TRINITY_DN633_c0_g1_i7.p1  ORF type:complete len:517 (-),score=66.63 TRINITY_DN633_c0_g1_i7:29-1474(-)